MNILITGSQGFIGSHLTRYLLNNTTHNIIGIDIQDKNVSEFNKYDRFKFYKMDCIAVNGYLDKFQDVNVIIHLAATVSQAECESNTIECFKNNVNGLLHVLELAKAIQCKQFIFSSSCAVYGDVNFNVNENTILQPISYYGYTKLLGEELCKMYNNLYNLKTNILRFFNVYGDGQNSSYGAVINTFLNNAVKHKPFDIYGDGKQQRDFIFVEDIVKIITTIIKKNNVPKIMNIGTGHPTSINQLAKIIKPRAKINYLPLRTFDIQYSCGDVKLLHNYYNEELTELEVGLNSMDKLEGD